MHKFLILLTGLALLAAPAHAADNERTVIVVMFDGVAPAMIEAANTPNFDRIREEGVWSNHLVPAFPTVSLSNHTTFATGCWPERHGIVSNVFIDPERGRYDHARDADWLTACEPMWQAAERQGVRSAVLGFTARMSESRGPLASHVDKEVRWEKWGSDMERAEEVVRFLGKPGAKRPKLIAIYLKGPDNAAHFKGTLAPETLAAVEESDAVVGRLMEAIEALPAGREVALVIGTDHGMMDVGPLINIGRIMGKHDIKGRIAASGASAYLYLDEGESAARVAEALAGYADAFATYRKGDYPAFAHVGDSARTGDFLLVAKPPYWLEGPEVFPDYAHWLGITKIWATSFTPMFGGIKAAHGYDPAIPEMHGIFYAWGAGIAHGREIDRLDMIDVHPTVMALMGLEPGAPVDGEAVAAVLAD
ncbi:MAG: ectonucleotide pyrophosphatase/phosphodiesterase [Parvibaculum sp.]|uniref:alkaline phosphatase family protein n=1 Tax=Parvibaculum sp. TaxID=2024848 RepID=UPI0034A04423